MKRILLCSSNPLLVKALCKDAQTLSPELAAGIVSMGFVEGSKTAPALLP